MTKRVERLLVTSNFLTFALVIALWIRSEVSSRIEETRFLALKSELLGNEVSANSKSTELGQGLFPDSWRFSPGGLARNYPTPAESSNVRPEIELPSWESPPSGPRLQIDDHPTDTTISEGETVNDLWYRAYMLNKLAEEKEARGNPADALRHYNDAEFLFHYVSENFPSFHPEIVKRRIEIIKSKRIQLKSIANQSRNEPPHDPEDQTASADEVEIPPKIAANSKSDPSDIWYRAYLDTKEAEELEAHGDLISALNKYNQAEPLFRAITREHPNFHHQIVIERLKTIQKAQTRIRVKLRARGAARN